LAQKVSAIDRFLHDLEIPAINLQLTAGGVWLPFIG
jgi:hypothetical protein